MNNIASEDKIIDIYWFHPLHQYFESKEENYLQHKGTGLPACATDIAPPQKPCAEGNIYIFNDKNWIEVEDNFDKPEYEEINYTYCLPLPPFFMPSKIIDPIQFFPEYSGIQDYIHPFHKSFALAKKYELAQNKYLYLKEIHAIFTNNADHFKSADYHYNYRVESEYFIMTVRSIFDELIQITFLLLQNTLKIEIDSIGELLKKKDKYIECYDIIFGNDDKYRKDNTNFLKTINNLFNSIKHSSIHYNAYQLYSNIPNIVSFQKNKQDFSNSEVIYHNYALDHLIFGFIDNFHRIIENQKIYLSTKATI